MLSMEKYENVDDGGGYPEMFFNGFAKDDAAKEEEEEKTEIIWFLDNLVIPRRRRTPRVDVTAEYYEQDKLVRKEPEIVIVNSGLKRCRKTSDEGENRKQKQKITSNGSKQKINPMQELIALGLEPPSAMPEEFKDCIQGLGGSEIKLVIQKIIYATDLSRTHNRFSMTMSQVRSKFLSEAEEEEVKNGGILSVILVQPCLEISEIHMTSWVSGKSAVYILKTEWNEVVRNNEDILKKMAVVQVWSFRVGPESKLGFAIIKVRDGYD